MKTIKLSNTPSLVALVNDADYEPLNRYKWRYRFDRNTYYAVTGARQTNTYWTMHEMLLGRPPEGYFWDHKDRNGLNNQRENLRLATFAQNRANSKLNANNTSGYKGVSFHFASGRWQATIYINKKRTHLGTFDSKGNAALAYNKAAIKQFGEFATLNQITL